MRFLTLQTPSSSTPTLALSKGLEVLSLPPAHSGRIAGGLVDLIAGGRKALREAAAILEALGVPMREGDYTFLPPLPSPGKIICVGLNYHDHTAESHVAQPDHPTIFLRVSTSVVGHGCAIVRPAASCSYDYEGELVAYIGTGGRYIAKANALDHVAGYSVGNEGTIRDFQMRTPQWTMGKNFDATGAIGPMFVSADELPPGGSGLGIQTRLNGVAVQSANTRDMVFDLATIISLVSEAMTLAPGDVIFTGTPAGVGAARTPPLYMKPGDVVEVQIESIGTLRNGVVQEALVADATR